MTPLMSNSLLSSFHCFFEHVFRLGVYRWMFFSDALYARLMHLWYVFLEAGDGDFVP